MPVPTLPAPHSSLAPPDTEHVNACFADAAWKTTFQRSGEGIVLLSSGGRIVHANPMARQLLLISPDSAPPDATSLLGQHPLQPTDGFIALPIHRQDGSILDAAVNLVILETTHDDCSWLMMLQDRRATAQAQQALETANRELKAMARRLFSAQEDERRAISRDLHDDIGQTITAIRLSAHAAMGETDIQRQREDLQHVLHLSDQAVSRLRDLSTLLRPPPLDALGLEAAISWQANLILRHTEITLTLDLHPLPIRPAAETEQACFRIAQECLTNIIRHAQASAVTLQLITHDDSMLSLLISDDGKGFELTGSRGLGLVMMRERAETAGGRLDIDSRPGGGTVIQCQLPYTPPGN